jgi:hypothetical protein
MLHCLDHIVHAEGFYDPAFLTQNITGYDQVPVTGNPYDY